MVAALAVLAAILFPVFAASKRKSYEPREAAQLQQIYLAVNLYEGDYDHESPPSLVTLVPTYLKEASLSCPTDTRRDLKVPDWPANPWVFSALQPLPPEELLRSRFINSYLYLKTFRTFMPSGRAYDEFRNNPEVGLVSGVGLWTCVSSPGAPGCVYSHGSPPADTGQPALNLSGTFLTVRTDGSIKTRRRPQSCAGGSGNLRTLFLFDDSECSNQSVSAG